MRLDKMVRPTTKAKSQEHPVVDHNLLRELADDIWTHARNYAADRVSGQALNPEVQVAKIRRELQAAASLIATELVNRLALSDKWKVELAGAKAELASAKKELGKAKGLIKCKRLEPIVASAAGPEPVS